VNKARAGTHACPYINIHDILLIGTHLFEKHNKNEYINTKRKPETV